MTPLDGDKMYTGGPKPEDMYPPGGYPPQGPGDVYTTPNSGLPFGFTGQQPPYPPPQYGPPPPQGGYGYPQQGGYPPPQGGYGYPPPGGYPSNPQDYSQAGYYGQPPPQQSVPMQSGPYRQGGNRSDLEYGEGGDDFTGFTDPEVRKNFVKKVYTILSIQLLCTAAIVYPFLYVDKVQEYVDDHSYLVFVAMAIYLGVMIALVCCEGARRSFPCNFILLAVLTLAMGFMCGVISSRYSTEIVLITLGMTALICLLVTFIACFAPVDITGCGLLMCLMAVALMIFGLVTTVCVMFFQIKIMVLVYSAVAVVVFCVFLMFDTQQIMGGKRIELSPEEYVLGALQLYVDVIQIFLNLLPLVAACFSDN